LFKVKNSYFYKSTKSYRIIVTEYAKKQVIWTNNAHYWFEDISVPGLSMLKRSKNDFIALRVDLKIAFYNLICEYELCSTESYSSIGDTLDLTYKFNLDDNSMPIANLIPTPSPS
jgi:hypothetical protein